MWYGQFVVAPFGRRIGVRATTPELLEEARNRILPGWVKEEGDDADFQWSLSETSATYESEVFKGNTVRMFDSYFHLYVGETAVDRTFIHAGVVVCSGKAILLPGRSYSGKSTLTRALTQLGATFYSDDLAVVDKDGLVYPYPKPMCFRKPGGGIEELPAPGWTIDLPATPVALVAGLQYDPSSPELEWQKLSPGNAAMLLLDNCLAGRREPARDIATIGRIATQASVFKGRRSHSEAAARLLLEHLSMIQQ